MAPVRGAAPITERKRESSAPPYCRHAISAPSAIVHLRANSGPRSPLTRAFSISGRCRGKGTRRPINATYLGHHPARSSLWDGRYSEGPDWPAPLRDAGLSMRVVSK